MPKDVVLPKEETDDEVMSESDADAMFNRQEEKKEQKTQAAMTSVDQQSWDRKRDPHIPPELEGRVWIAVYKCPEGHKTKATNRQRETGIRCEECLLHGKEVKADIMPGLFDAPPTKPVDDSKRVNARWNRG